jgi:hypothetical protein
MWGDSKFCELSSPDPCAKYLWIFLLTGPHTRNIPGLFCVGEMALAEELGWTLRRFRAVFAELVTKGLALADWQSRVVWIPNAVRYNSPENPNVVKSWRHAWDEIPECALKAKANEKLKLFTNGLGEVFGEAFAEACAMGLPNQEQEPEQKQDQAQKQEKELRVGSSPAPEDESVITFPLNDGTDYAITSTNMIEWEPLYPSVDVMQELRKMRGWLLANKQKRKSKSGILRFVVRWLAKEQNRAPIPPAPAAVPERPAALQSEYKLPSDLDVEAGAALWKAVRQELSKRINRHSFDTWILPIKAAGISGRTLYVMLPTSNFLHVQNKFAATLIEIIGGETEIKFVAPEGRVS